MSPETSHYQQLAKQAFRLLQKIPDSNFGRFGHKELSFLSSIALRDILRQKVSPYQMAWLKAMAKKNYTYKTREEQLGKQLAKRSGFYDAHR